jgi:HK97 family phage major capsid protein
MMDYQPRKVRRTQVREQRTLQLAAAPVADREEFRRHLDLLEEETGGALDVAGAELYSNFRAETIRGIAGTWPELPEVASLAETIVGDEKFTVAAFRSKVLEMIGAKRGNPIITGKLEADNAGYRAQYGEGGREVFAHTLKNFKSERNAYGFGMWLLSQMPGREDARRWCSEHGYSLQRSINSNVGSEGGFLIPEQLSDELIRNFDSHGVARQEARVWPMSSLSLTVPTRESGLTASFGDEGVATNATDPGFGAVTLNTKNVRCVAEINRETLQDSIIGMSDFIAGEISEAFAFLEDSCMFIGDGTSAYGGMTGLKNALAAGSRVDAVAGPDLVGEIDVTDIANLMAALPQYAHAGAKFFCSMALYAAVLQRMLLNAGGNTIQILERGASNRPSFAGYDVVLSPTLPTGVGSTNYNGVDMLYFGNARRAIAFGDRREVAMLVDPYTLAAKGQIRMIGYERFDCVVHGIGTASAPGPIIALRGKT